MCDGDDGGTEFRIFHVEGGDLTLNDLTVSNGCANAGGLGDTGGGILNGSNGIVEIHSSTISGNRAEAGGGIFNQGTLEIHNSTISENSAFGPFAGGGGIFNQFMLEINNSAITGNMSELDAGGIFNGSTLEISNSTISGNEANNTGGGIRNGFEVEINSSTISGNSAEEGGGIYTFTQVEIINTIVANQLSGGDCFIFSGSPIISLGHNLDSDNTCEFDETSDKPGTSSAALNLGPLADNGGPTLTHALLTTPTLSVAVDMGDPAGCFDTNGALLTTDQRGPGFPRTIDGDGNGSVICDIGAYEFEPPPSGPLVIVPTMGQWGIILAALILAMVAVLKLRRTES